MNKKTATGILIVVLAAATTLAWGKQDGENETLALAKAKLSLNQAIDKALSIVPGQAMSAEFDDEGKTPVFVIEIVSQGQVHEVTLDTQSGKLISNKLDDEDDHDHDNDKDKKS